MTLFQSKLKEVLQSVLPIVLIVIAVHLFLFPLERLIFIRFIAGAVLVTFGLAIFLTGVDIGITPIGVTMGSILAKSNKLRVVVFMSLILGFIVSVAEPDLHILAAQVNLVTDGVISRGTIVIVVSIGIAIMLCVGLLRILYNRRINRTFTLIYLIIGVMALFSSAEFLAISFDASGATTGALTVPFILALATGVSKLAKDAKGAEENSFGLVGVASTGAILLVLATGLIKGAGELHGQVEIALSAEGRWFDPYVALFWTIAKESLIALVPIALIFILTRFSRSVHVSRNSRRKVYFGLIYTFVGLVLFLIGVNAGFMRVGSILGYQIIENYPPIFAVVLGLILGVVTILAEPAVYVLTHQVEAVTTGYVKRSSVLVTLAIGVGLAVMLSVIRILVPGLQLWHFLLPGYVISLSLSFLVPNLFVGIAFDAGGVASGPMTATFILAFAHGVATAVDTADVMVDGFGIIAMVAMTPIIALQILGALFKVRQRKEITDEAE